MAGRIATRAFYSVVFSTLAANGLLFSNSRGGLVDSATTVVNSTLYIDGGKFTDHDSNLEIDDNLTSQIDLEIPWTSKSVKMVSIATKAHPFKSGQVMFYNKYDNTLCRFGGYISLDRDTHPGLSILPLDGELNPRWVLSKAQPPRSIIPPYLSLAAKTPESLYLLDGVYDAKINATYGLSQFVKYDFLDDTWSTIFSDSYSAGYYAGGAGVYVPNFGDEGVILFLAGVNQMLSKQYFVHRYEYSSTSRILVFDISSRKFYPQVASSATGDLPLGRTDFCAVGVEDPTSGGYDVFLFGGLVRSKNVYGYKFSEREMEDASSVWVLSIPSFQWTQVKGSPFGRGLRRHSCEVIGRRQMAVIGGIPINSGGSGGGTIGPTIFNMATLQWAGGYDPHAASYTRAPLLAQNAKKKPFPLRWQSPELEKIFPPKKASIAPTVAGAVVGAVVAIMSILIIFWYCRRRRRRTAARLEAQQNFKSQNETDAQQRLTYHPNFRLAPHSTGGGQEVLPVHPNVSELPGSPVSWRYSNRPKRAKVTQAALKSDLRTSRPRFELTAERSAAELATTNSTVGTNSET